MVSEIRPQVENFKATGKIIGFVPTMGTLHRGHLSLIERARNECDVVIASIFVNPTQFNDTMDFESYPRNIDTDLELLRNAGCDIAFVPEYSEIYPRPDTTPYHFGAIEERFEGAHRPGHFKGVGMVVRRFFEIIKPHKAYFGLKDYQQVMVIKSLVKQFNLNVEIAAAPTKREADGLAMSSRNLLLSPSQRKAASRIYQVLDEVRNRASKTDIGELIVWATNEIDREPELKTEYFEIAHPATLEPIADLKNAQQAIALVAVKTGRVRLIDNLEFFVKR